MKTGGYKMNDFYENIKNLTSHRELYYFTTSKDGNSMITDDIFPEEKKLSCYYQIDEFHIELCKFIHKMDNNSKNCEEAFHTYIKTAFTKDMHELNTCYKTLWQNIRSLHVFFARDEAVKFYIESNLARFWKNYLKSFLNTDCFEGKSIDEKVELLYQRIALSFAPIFASGKYDITNISGNLKKASYQEFSRMGPVFLICDSLEYKSKTDFASKLKNRIIELTCEGETKPLEESLEFFWKNYVVLEDLRNLVTILNHYTSNFSILIKEAKNFTCSQITACFLTQDYVQPLQDALSYIEQISFPQKLPYILWDTLRRNAPTGNDYIHIGHDSILTKYLGREEYKKLFELSDLSDSEKKDLLNNLETKFNKCLPPYFDAFIKSPTYIFHYFEQLIYMELYQIIFNKEFYNRGNCGHYYITSDRRMHYCPLCKERSNYDKTYNEKQNAIPIWKKKNELYNNMRYQCKKFNRPKEYFTKWSKQLSELYKYYIKNNKINDVEDFENDVKKILVTDSNR